MQKTGAVNNTHYPDYYIHPLVVAKHYLLHYIILSAGLQKTLNPRHSHSESNSQESVPSDSLLRFKIQPSTQYHWLFAVDYL